MDEIMLFELIISNNTKILERNPVKGGIPPIEKKIITNEKAHILLTLKKFVKLERNKDVVFLLKNLLMFD